MPAGAIEAYVSGYMVARSTDFQCQLVRLRLVAAFAGVTAFAFFQCQLVRLRLRHGSGSGCASSLSMPAGAIEAVNVGGGGGGVVQTFQCQLVRLRLQRLNSLPDLDTNFQCQLVRLRRHLLDAGREARPHFQCQLVRLRPADRRAQPRRDPLFQCQLVRLRLGTLIEAASYEVAFNASWCD